MQDEREEKLYPVKSLHDFLTALDQEWSKFRTGAEVSLIGSCALLIFLILRILLLAPRGIGFIDVAFFVLVSIFLVYSIYAMSAQYQFFSKWERRIGLLIHMEEELISKMLSEQPSKTKEET